MPQNCEYAFIGHGPEVGSGFTIEYDEDVIVVNGWTGSTVQVFSERGEIGSIRQRPRVPDLDSLGGSSGA